MRRFEIDRRGATAIERGLPTSHADTPAVARLQTRKTPLRDRRDEIVSIENGEIEKFLGHFHANRVQPDVFRPGAAITVAVESRYRIAATAAQVGSQDVGRHGRTITKERRFPNRRFGGSDAALSA